MIGDKLVITEYHRMAAKKIMAALEKKWQNTEKDCIAVTVAGESGSGKSEIAYCLSELVKSSERKTIILGQDDYFKLPPKTNHKKRIEDIGWVGTNEVQLDLLDKHIHFLKSMENYSLQKPLVDFAKDSIGSETIEPTLFDVIIAEGTYTTLLKNSDLKVFIDRNYKDTKKHRLERNRDPDVNFLEKILEIEHQEIKKHKAIADLVIPPPEQ